MRSSIISAVLAAALAQAQIQGFNYGSTQTDGSIKDQAAFTAEFNAAKALVGTSGFTSARLYTMIQGGTENTPISAIPAAIATKTTLLLGLWASGGQAGMTAEIAALKSAISQYGTEFTSLVTGISVGSEDLYRISPTGIAAKSGVGADPATVASYITQVRSALQGTALSGAGIGHVDTWTAWVNGSNSAVINAVDWVGMDAYPYFQSTQANGIENGKALFDDALAVTRAAVGGKTVWVTETGWPVSGDVSGAAVANLANARTYWQQVGCPLFGSVNTYWFTLQDAYPTTPNPSFGIVGSTLSTTPLFDLSCSAVSSSSSSASRTSTSASASSTNTASILASASSAASAQTAAQAPSAGNNVGSSSVRAPVTASGNGTSFTTAAGGIATTVATATSARVTSSGSAAGTGAVGSGSGSGASSTTSARTSAFTGAAATGAGSIIAAAGALAAAIYAL